jgi:hypothetical protein
MNDHIQQEELRDKGRNSFGTTLSRALAATYLLLSIYSLGGGVVEGFVYYPAWKMVGPAEFPGFHRSLSDRLIPAFVTPFFLSVLVNLLLAWRRPPELPRRLVLLALGLNSLIVLVTFALAIPIQAQLAKTLSIEAIDRLIGYDRLLRLAPGLIIGGINWAILYRILNREVYPPGLISANS